METDTHDGVLSSRYGQYILKPHNQTKKTHNTKITDLIGHSRHFINKQQIINNLEEVLEAPKHC